MPTPAKRTFRRWKNLPSRRLALIVSIAVFILLSAGSIWTTYSNYSTQKQHLIHYASQQEINSFKSSQKALRINADVIFTSAINQDDILSLMAKAYHGDAAVRNEVRETLYNRLEPLYRLLKSEYIRQLHFHLPDSSSFLRFHRPAKFGDDLSDVRYSIEQVHKTQKPIFGFEEGRIFNGFRHVYPLHYQGELVGSVEISFSIDAIYHLITHDHNEAHDLLLKKDLIKHKVFENEQGNYAPSEISANYVVDKSVQYHEKRPNSISRKRIHAINEKLHDDFQGILGQCNVCHLVTNINQTYYLVTFFPLKNTEGQAVGYIVNYINEPGLRIVTENFMKINVVNESLLFIISLLTFFYLRNQIRQKRLLHKMARTDSLTSLPNRNVFKRALNEQMKLSKSKQLPLSLVFFDIDHFKKINDTHGHLMGDKVLKTVARAVEDGLTNKDVFARWGGEEFVILLPETYLEDAEKVAERLRKKLETLDAHDLHITSSFGVTELKHKDTAESLMHRGDSLLYRSKEDGRNRVTVG
jgi:diguanylate cyclase (GGDEF)-like protein